MARRGRTGPLPSPPGARLPRVSAPPLAAPAPAASAAPRRRALTTIFFTILLDLIGFGMILPLLPFYAQELKASELGVGILFASYSLTQLLFAPPLGRLSDRLGRRPVLLG